MGPSQQGISILLAIGRTMSADLYAQALKRHSGYRVVACVSTIDEALQTVQARQVDVALISSTLKDGPLSGLMLLQSLREACPSVKSVLLLENTEAHLATIALCAGARGVLSAADDCFKSLCRCVKQVNAGQVWANSAQVREVLDTFTRRAPVRVVNAVGAQLLTRREDDIVRLVADGLTNRQIAKELELSEHTVRNNLFRVFDKLGVSTRVELALYAVNHERLVPSEEPNGRQERKNGNRISPLDVPLRTPQGEPEFSTALK